MALANITQLEPFNLDSSANYSFANLTLTGNVTASYFVGNGALLTGLPASYANSNVATFLASYGSNTITTTGNVTVGNIIGNGQALTGINGSNVTGQVSYAAVANSVAVANVSGIGNIATINKDGNASNLLYGNGVFAAAPVSYGNSNVATFLASFGSNTISTTGNVSVGNITVGGNLTVNGTLTSINSTIVEIDDLAIVLANDASSASQANGAGVIINGANANMLYISSTNSFTFSHSISTAGNITAGNLTTSGTVNLTTSSNVSLGAVGNVHITGGVSGQMLQTDGNGNVAWVTPTGTTITVDNFTGNGVQTAYTLSVTPVSKAYTMVALAGTLQPRTVYNLAGNVVTFSSPPPSTAPIEITTFSITTGAGNSDVTANTFTANTVTANTLSGNIVSSNANLTVNTLTANTLSSNNIINTGTGTPTLNSSTSINLTAATVVRATTSPFQFYNCTTTVRDAIAASNGYVIYNTTTNKLQVYANGTWVDLH